MRIIDLFSGIGSFHKAAHDLGHTCVFASDIDPVVAKVYEANYGLKPAGDITALNLADDIPDHDVLCGGFPCQPFSQIGKRQGSDEARGRLIDYVEGALKTKRPRAFVLENVKGLLTSHDGDDFRRITKLLSDIGYAIHWKVLRADDYGIPQMRNRLFIVGIRMDVATRPFVFPAPVGNRTSLAQYLDRPFIKPSAYTIRCGGRNSGIDDRRNWDSYHLDGGATYTLTVEDCTRLQGFEPTTWDWAGVTDRRKLQMLGNTIPTCLTKAVLGEVFNYLEMGDIAPRGALIALSQLC